MLVLSERFYRCADVFMSVFMFTPLSVMLWRSTWHLQDFYILHEDEGTSAVISAFTGSAALLVFNLFQYRMQSFMNARAKFLRFICIRIWIYVFALSTIFQWRGVWLVFDHYSGITPLSAWSCLAAGVAVLCSLRCFRSCVGPPLVVEVDFNRNLCLIPSRFRSNVSREFSLLM